MTVMGEWDFNLQAQKKLIINRRAVDRDKPLDSKLEFSIFNSCQKNIRIKNGN